MNPADLRVRNFRLFPADEPLGQHERSLTIDLERTALLLIDVYHAADDPTASELVHAAWDVEFWRSDRRSPRPGCRPTGAGDLPVVYAMNSAPMIALDRSPYGWSFRESLGFDPESDFAEPDGRSARVSARGTWCSSLFLMQSNPDRATSTCASTHTVASSKPAWRRVFAIWIFERSFAPDLPLIAACSSPFPMRFFADFSRS